MTADRLMLLTLVVADEVNDAEGDGLDLEDFQEAVFAAVAYTESALFNQVLSTWLSMNPSPNLILNDLKPSMDAHRRLIAPWSCSTMLFR